MPEKTYKVVGTASILDHPPGSTFEADLSDVEDYLIGIGGLEVVSDDKPTPPDARKVAAPIKNPSVPIPDGRDAERE